MCIEEGFDFSQIVTTYCPQASTQIQDYPGILLLGAALNEDKSSFSGINEDSFNVLKEVTSHLCDQEGDLEFVLSSLCNHREQNPRLDWVIKLFESLANKDFLATTSSDKPELKVRLLNQWYGANINQFGIIKDIIEETYTIKMTKSDDYDLVIDGVFGYKPINNKSAFKIFYTGERLLAKLDGYDLSLGFDLLTEHKNYIRLPLYYLYFGELISAEYQRDGECNPNKPYFACFLVSNPDRGDGAEARNHVFHSLSSYKLVASGGSHLNNIGEVIPREETYKFLSQCKFVISYENDGTYPGYITEKVFQAYYAGSVPLYYSHPTGQKDINKQAIISAQDFNTEEEMINYVIEVDQDDKKYCDIWQNPIITEPQYNYEFVKNKIREKLYPLLAKG